MKFGVIVAAALAVAGSASAAAGEIFSYEKTFGDWPEGCAPKEVGARIVRQFLSTEPEGYKAKGFTGHKYGEGVQIGRAHV